MSNLGGRRAKSSSGRQTKRAVTSDRMAAVIYHPEKADLRRIRTAVDNYLKPLGWRPTLWLPTDGDSHGAHQAREALAAGATNILVVGGDGTVRPVVKEVYQTEVSVGLVPQGTGNVLARNLGIALNQPAKAVARGLLGEVKPIDLGSVTLRFADGSEHTEVFTGFTGIGLDATIMMRTNARLKRRIGWVAYVDAGFRSIPLGWQRLEISVDGAERRRLKVLMLMVGNCGFLPGSITMMPDARLDDGTLDVASVGPRKLWNWIDLFGRVTFLSWFVRPWKLGRRLLDGTANVKTLDTLNGRVIEIWPTGTANIQVDGDPFGQIVYARFEVLPRALKMRL